MQFMKKVTAAVVSVMVILNFAAAAFAFGTNKFLITTEVQPFFWLVGHCLS